MSNLRTLLLKLHVPEATIKAFEGEKLPDNSDKLLAEYTASRLDFFKGSDEYKAALKAERDKTFSGTQLSLMKKVNSELGLDFTNSQLEEFKDFSEFITKVNKHFESQKKSPETDEELKKWKKKATDYKKDFDDISGKYKKLEEETPIKIQEAKDSVEAEKFFLDMVLKDEELKALKVPGKEFSLETIKEKIFATAKVGKDGKIKALDGTNFIHPEKDVVVSELSELFGYYKEKAGLIKRSNAGDGGLGDGLEGDETLDDEILQQMADLKAARR